MATSRPESERTTAAGVRLSFHTKPHRHYQINGTKVPSVTQVLGVLDKPALPPWAAKVTAEGIWQMVRKTPGYEWPDQSWKLAADLKRAGLDHRSVTSEAALRGTTVHGIFEDWVKDGKIPNAGDYPAEWRGYIRALARCLVEFKGEFHSAEMIVGSAKHGFAGTCDTVAVTTGTDGKRVRWDFKTSKGVYARTHFRQLAAYELASVECGEDPTDAQAIVVLRKDGTYETAFSFATAQDFLNVLQVWRDDQPLAKHENDSYKARVAREREARKR